MAIDRLKGRTFLQRWETRGLHAISVGEHTLTIVRPMRSAAIDVANVAISKEIV
jgi:hypothetical protein